MLFSLFCFRSPLLGTVNFDQNWQRHKQKYVTCVVHGLVDFVEITKVKQGERNHKVTAPNVVERSKEAMAQPPRHHFSERGIAYNGSGKFVPKVENEASEEKVEEARVKTVPHRAHHEANEGGEDPRLAFRVELAEVDVVFEPLVNGNVPRGQEVFHLVRRCKAPQVARPYSVMARGATLCVPVEAESTSDRPTLHEAETNQVHTHNLKKCSDNGVNLPLGGQRCEFFRHREFLVKMLIERDAHSDKQHDLRESFEGGQDGAWDFLVLILGF